MLGFLVIKRQNLLRWVHMEMQQSYMKFHLIGVATLLVDLLRARGYSAPSLCCGLGSQRQLKMRGLLHTNTESRTSKYHRLIVLLRLCKKHRRRTSGARILKPKNERRAQQSTSSNIRCLVSMIANASIAILFACEQQAVSEQGQIASCSRSQLGIFALAYACRIWYPLC